MKALGPVLILLIAGASLTGHPVAAKWMTGLWMVLAACGFWFIWIGLQFMKKRGDKRGIRHALELLDAPVPFPTFAAWLVALVAHISAGNWPLSIAWLGSVALGWFARHVCKVRGTDLYQAILSDEQTLAPHLHDA